MLGLTSKHRFTSIPENDAVMAMRKSRIRLTEPPDANACGTGRRPIPVTNNTSLKA